MQAHVAGNVTGTFYNVTGLVSGVTYYFWVQVFLSRNCGGYYAQSNSVTLEFGKRGNFFFTKYLYPQSILVKTENYPPFDMFSVLYFCLNYHLPSSFLASGGNLSV